MAIDTYAELCTAVANWLARDDLTDRIPEFVTLAEAKFNRDLKCPQTEKRSTTTISTTNDEPEFITLPTDFQAMRRVRLSSVTGKPRLEFKSGTQADEYRYSISNTSGQPKYFTVFGTELELLPTPDDDYTIEMVYRANLAVLSTNNSVNWLLALAPDLYLYGALLESAPYIKEDARIATWAQGFGYALDSVNAFGRDQMFNTGPLTVTTSALTP